MVAGLYGRTYSLYGRPYSPIPEPPRSVVKPPRCAEPARRVNAQGVTRASATHIVTPSRLLEAA